MAHNCLFRLLNHAGHPDRNSLYSILSNLSFRVRNLQTAAFDMPTAKTYQEAIAALNTLQSNAQVLEKARRERSRNAANNIKWMENLLRYLDVEPSDLDRLNVIHISGTKGKGSTCAFTESLLRHLGYKTGFYSSPHLVAVRERIRINGRPISEELFTQYFWEVYGRLIRACQPDEMPPYFKFLTVMCFYVFLKEKIEVAVMEVGIGGAYDCTNVIRNPVVCGVTSLGYDHMPILGNTLAEIAWHKAGIFKRNCPAVTVTQPPEAMAVLQGRAAEIGAALSVSPDLSAYGCPSGPIHLGIEGAIQSLNASLALQLVKLWLMRKTDSVNETLENWDSDEENVCLCKENSEIEKQSAESAEIEKPVGSVSISKLEKPAKIPDVLEGYKLSSILVNALESCVWPGRFQTIRRNNVQYYLDGAHTKDSVEYCAQWFKKVQETQTSARKFLIFNSTADRKPEDLLRPLVSCGFDAALFCPNILGGSAGAGDLLNFTVNRDHQMARCSLHESVWKSLSDERCSQCFATVADALSWIEGQAHGDDEHVGVLVTGSLHLVGAVLTVLDPSLHNTL
ncbi:folylpolyglutamate synthase, mitochondrial-like isoform X1 [Paramacrobiotus metropolitanus]|uniref:folylpolyglutamate synthase, mitochondrial-like isoform X1 n=2 Tax=Paramacrobiotus metropolitanus TaxID=2943436 RepID=UPI0024462CC1|nr:folylpolyglutamate synthase, mitochondrial-like isoform X1 [Paramacrobiotus metropolitanus]